MTTICQLIDLAVEDARAELRGAYEGPIGDNPAREFTLAITDLENARMRINRGFAMKFGVYNPGDVQRFNPAAAVTEERQAHRT